MKIFMQNHNLPKTYEPIAKLKRSKHGLVQIRFFKALKGVKKI